MRRQADLAGADPFPAEEPQAQSDRDQMHSEFEMDSPDHEETWQFVMNGTHVSVSPASHGELFEGLAHSDFHQPHAYGKLVLRYRWDAEWHVDYSNMSLHLVEQRLKRYTNDQGWNWTGLFDDEGMPMDFQSLKTKMGSVPGIGEINPGLKDWRNDEWAGMEMFDNPGDKQTETPYYGLQDPPKDIPMSDPRTCSECGELLMNYDKWREHILRNHVNPDRLPPDSPQPVVDLDDVLPAGFNEAIMDKTVQRQSRLIFQFGAAAQSTKPQIPGPVPFIYDIEGDRIYVGAPGSRAADIQLPGRMTPGGIIEGLYDPQGNVQIKTVTDMPYTVRHMVELWYHIHPDLIINGMELNTGDKSYKLASSNIGHIVRSLAATDPAAWDAFQALKSLGDVYAVGGAVRDVVLGKTPKDIDLMVRGVQPEDVEDALRSLPGRVDFTGKQFGVFRYRSPDGSEVEVALPRTERSTGAGHRDFEVYTDPNLSVGEDLARRDFTGNAMAVNLSTGQLVDPYGGAEHLKSGVLRTVSDRSFPEDPLRILRALASVSRHGLEPSPETFHDMAAHASSLAELPAERIQMELDKVMAGDDPAKAITLAEETGLLPYILPELQATVGFNQLNRYHKNVLNEHIKSVLDHVSKLSPDLDVRWAALLHDIGKPRSQWIDSDGQAHYYCIDPDARILTADLIWKRSGDLVAGDEIVAFSEESPRFWRLALVVDNSLVRLPSYRLKFKDGRSIISSADHLWFTRSGDDGYWRTTESIARKPEGVRIIAPFDVWETDITRDGGWLAGFFDGEGTIGGTQVAFSQKYGAVRSQAAGLLRERGYMFQDWAEDEDDAVVSALNGGLPEQLRFLGSIRPTRLLAKWEQLLVSRKTKTNVAFKVSMDRCAEVESIEGPFMFDVAAIGTSSRTFFVEGLASHNSGPNGEGDDHETVGANMAREALTRLKFPNDRIDRITHLVQHHMFGAFNSTGGARKFLNRVGDQHGDDLLNLREADIGGKETLNAGNVDQMRGYVNAVRQAGEPTALSQLAIGGKDLIQAGIKPGPIMGQILNALLQMVIENPELNTPEALVPMAVQMAGQTVAKTANILDDLQISEGRNQDGDPIFTATSQGQEVGWLVLRPMGGNIMTGAEPGDEDYDETADHEWYQVGNVTVEPDFRRMGVATALYRAAQRRFEIEHDWDQMTPEGAEWAKKVGHQHSDSASKGYFQGNTMTITGDHGYRYVYQWTDEDLHQVQGHKASRRVSRTESQ